MVDFSNPNLCGASPEINDVFAKLEKAADEIEAKIDEAASTAAAAFQTAQDEINNAVNKLQTIEIPELPKLNLQAEITNLTTLTEGSPEYVSALAKITQEFDSTLTKAGFELGTLIKNATSTALSGGNLCAVVPNFEKESGSTEDATQKAEEVKQAAVAAVTEVVSKVNQNEDVKQKVEEIANKVKNFAVGTSANPPTEDTPKFKFALPSAFKTIQVSATPQQLPQPSNIEESKSKSAPKVVPPKIKNSLDRKNVIKKEDGDGFATRKAKKLLRFSFAGKETPKGLKTTKIDVVDGNYQFKLKHKPTRIYKIFAHIENVPKKLIQDGVTKRSLGDSDEAKRLRGLGLQHPSTEENLQFVYDSWYGRHLSLIYATGTDGRTYMSDKMNMSLFGDVLVLGTTLSVVDHPANIDSGGYFQYEDPDNFAVDRYEATLNGKEIRTGRKKRSDKFGNRVFGNLSFIIRYYYLERYDPNYQA